MEFLRFGSSITGNYWGCCCVDIIQNFNHDPDSKASIQLVSGDSGGALTHKGKPAYAGPTYRDIFKTRIRIGTFGTSDMPNHGFLAVLTASQLSSPVGKKWLAILKEEGFEFIRAMDNSVYSGPSLNNGTPHPNYLFGLFRNVGGAAIKDPFTPPKQWTDLDGGMPGVVDFLSAEQKSELLAKQTDYQTERWKANGPTVITNPDDLIAAGAPVTKAGGMGAKPKPITDEYKKKADGKAASKPADPFASPAAIAV